MPSANQMTKPQYVIIFVGPEGSGKTRCALSFPKIFAITFDPVGLEIVFDPINEKFKNNLVWTVPLNGIPVSEVFTYTEEPSEKSLYGAIALAKEMKKRGEIETILLDGGTYFADLKQDHVADDRDTRAMYRQIGSFLNQFYLQNFIPLATQHGIHVLTTLHVQRESHDTVEGIQDTTRKEYGTSKALLNANCDVSPQIVGGFRQKIAGMPSAVIYLSHRLDDVEKEGGGMEKQLNYYAYCQKTYVSEWKSEVNAKNRYGLPARLKLSSYKDGKIVGANFYSTLQSKLPQSSGSVATTNGANAQPTTKGETK